MTIGTGFGTISSETNPVDTTTCMRTPIVITNNVVTTIGRFNTDDMVYGVFISSVSWALESGTSRFLFLIACAIDSSIPATDIPREDLG